MFLFAVILVCASLFDISGAITERISYCGKVNYTTKQWKAFITFSEPVEELNITGGNVSFISADGLHLEIIGTELEEKGGDFYACISIQWAYNGTDPPTLTVNVTAVPTSEVVIGREIRSMRPRRATTVWSVSSVPVTTTVSSLLKSFEPYHQKWGDDSMSGTTKHSSSGALTIFYAKGSYSQSTSKRGVGFFTTPTGLPKNTDDLILKYDVYFESFGFGRMGKLPGLYGGVEGSEAYKCSGGSNPSTCFSLRFMWRSGGAGELYAYIPTNQEPGFSDRPDVIANSDHGQSIGRGKIKFQNGVWQTVTQQVHLNTVGKTDGWVKFCNQVSGGSQQCYTATNLRMRNSSTHHLRGLFFSTFFGGSSTADAAPNDCRTYYRNLSIQIP